jgi:hypothetical protein
VGAIYLDHHAQNLFEIWAAFGRFNAWLPKSQEEIYEDGSRKDARDANGEKWRKSCKESKTLPYAEGQDSQRRNIHDVEYLGDLVGSLRGVGNAI